MESTSVDPFSSLELTRKSLYEQIADSIQNLIAVDSLREGDQLPSERELAKRLEVSRNTVREGIRVLEQRGLVTMRPGSGTYVTQIPPENLARSIERYFTFGPCTHESLVELRDILEPGSAYLAASRATASDLEKLEKALRVLERAFEVNDVRTQAEYDTRFHVVLARATHNELISAIILGLQNTMLDWIKTQVESYRFEAGARSHRAVFEAVKNSDAEGARESMLVHNATTRQTLGH